MMDQSKSRPISKNVFSFPGIFLKNHRLFAVLTAVLIISILELIIVQRKYDLFTGGFLQTHAYVSAFDRIRFLAVSIWFDLFVAVMVAGPWFWITARFGKNQIIGSYRWFFLFTLAVLSALLIKYKILSYFNDTINFIIIRNLGGGSVLEALSYIADEVVILFAIIIATSSAYFLGVKFIRIWEPTISSSYNRPFPAKTFLTFLVLILVATLGLITFVNNEENLRYGMRKKLSFYVVTSLFDLLSDFDSDRFGLFYYPTDPKPFDRDIYPGAVDFPNNGIDEDGFGGDFGHLNSRIDAFDQLQPKAGKHIVLIVLESARQDIVDKKVNGRLVAPNINEIAQRYTNIDFAYSHTGLTASSLLAIFNRTFVLKDDKITLLEFLKKSGYKLCFFSGQDESFGDVASTIGMNDPENFFFDASSALQDRVFASKQAGSLRLSEARVVQEFERQLQKFNWRKPQFIYINLQAAHFPYSHPRMPKILTNSLIPRSAISAHNRGWIQLTYWNALAVADKAVGRIIQLLKSASVYDDTLLVITGDHGESLFDDGFLGHGHILNEMQTHIPLIINQSNLAIREPVGQIDLAEIMVRAATEQPNIAPPPVESKAVFQFVGTYRKPSQIGIVELDEKRTIFDLYSREVFFSDSGKRQSLDTVLANDDDYRKRTSRLINIWENIRWKDYEIRHLQNDAETQISKAQD